MVEFACHAHCWGTWLCLPCTLLRHWVCLPCTLLRHLSVPAMHTAEALSVPAMHTAEALSVPAMHTAEALVCAWHAHCWGTWLCLTFTLLRHLSVLAMHKCWDTCVCLACTTAETLECACHAQLLRHNPCRLYNVNLKAELFPTDTDVHVIALALSLFTLQAAHSGHGST